MALTEYSPAISPLKEHLFNPVKDAMELRTAIMEMNTDWGTLVNILTARSLDQRLKIARNYKSIYRVAFTMHLMTYAVILFDDIKHLILAMMQPLPMFYAEQLYNALDAINVDEDALVSILATFTNADKTQVLAAYEKRYGRTLQSNLQYKTSGLFRKLLLQIVSMNRTESEEVNEKNAQIMAQTLIDSYNKGKDATKIFFYIMTTESYAQIAAIDAKYQKFTGDPLSIYVSNLYVGDTMFALWDLLLIANEGVPAFLAKCLHKAMAGPGTKESHLTTIVVGRSEIDLDAIDNAFFIKYRQRSADWIADDTSGFYRTALLKILD